MKTTLLSLLIGYGCAFFLLGCTALPTGLASGQAERRIWTGSHLAQSCHRADTITTAATPVTVLDHERLRRLGIRSLAELSQAHPIRP